MELRHLRYFVAIAEERNFTRAAERLWVAQPGLSTQIRRLEAELGVRLFDRHTRGVELTAAGKLFLERARAALAAAELARAVGHDFGQGLLGEVRVGVSTGLRPPRTPEILYRFFRWRPRVELTVIEGHSRTLVHRLEDGRLDVVLAPSRCASPGLRQAALGSEPWVLFAGSRHPLAGSGPLQARALAGSTILVPSPRDDPGHEEAVQDLLRDIDVPASFARSAPGPAVYQQLAGSEGVVLSTGLESLPMGICVRRLEPPRTLPFSMLWRDEAPAPALTEFVRIAQATAAPQPSQPRRLAAVT
ncbi:MAG TPA: LysR family transcriptional regulator [Solirubrobacteraceae bacterium]|nr:LysR family transcriptional regulator [Solirubrobacteraceae bacterium]